VLREYWPNFRHLIHNDLTYGTGLGWQGPFWYLGLVVVVVGAILLIRAAYRGDQFFLLCAYALIGGTLFVALYDAYSHFREELVFLPPAAVGLALLSRYLGDRLRRHAGRWRSGKSTLLAPGAASRAMMIVHPALTAGSASATRGSRRSAVSGQSAPPTVPRAGLDPASR
jgi:hypothetical protein